jgi:hypothetical protein
MVVASRHKSVRGTRFVTPRRAIPCQKGVLITWCRPVRNQLRQMRPFALAVTRSGAILQALAGRARGHTLLDHTARLV